MPTPFRAPGTAALKLASCMLKDCCAGAGWPGWANAAKAENRIGSACFSLLAGLLPEIAPLRSRPRSEPRAVASGFAIRKRGQAKAYPTVIFAPESGAPGGRPSVALSDPDRTPLER